MSALPEIQTPSPNGSLTADVFAAHLASLSHLPKWWLDLKRTAWNRFVALPLPKRTDEFWRFSNAAGVKLDGYEVGRVAPNAPALPTPGFAHSANLAFANNRLASTSALPADLAARGVIFTPLEDALVKHADLVRRYFQAQAANLGADKLAALNAALTTSGAFLYVPRGVEIPSPFVATHAAAGAGSAVFPHTIVIAEDHAKVTLVEFFLSTDETKGFASGVNDLHAGDGAQLTYVGAQNWSRDTLSIQSNATTVQRDARVLSLNVHLGGRQSRHESHSRLQGPGAHSEMLALTVAQDTQEFDQRTLQTHQAPHTSSNLLYKNALLDRARTIFSGLIVVDPDAQKTDAYQSNRNLVLSPEAEASSLPGLEIQANDVRCTHGATTGHVDDEQMFYLESRGIRPALARELIVFGFFEEVLNKLENDELHAALRELIQSKFKK
ncbi:MAG TPA: Fe-S cluster assembly protein SufD [Opitutaceae bacterium]|jgi:Fe-S cluster assembly protein SufD|nr:Fe-S cluster assembly protein SufD [Opitutaceae bacterium]